MRKHLTRMFFNYCDELGIAGEIACVGFGGGLLDFRDLPRFQLNIPPNGLPSKKRLGAVSGFRQLA